MVGRGYCFILVSLIQLATVAAAQQVPASSPSETEAAQRRARVAAAGVIPTKGFEQFVPYWTVEGGWHTDLQLRNNLSAGNLVVTPVLRTADGTETPLLPVSLLPGEVQSINLHDALSAINSNLAARANAYGSIVLRYDGRGFHNLYGSVMVHDSGHPIMYHLDASSQATGFNAGSREGIWWLPTESTRDYLILTNDADHALLGTLWIYDASGRSWSQPLQLGARQTQRLSVRQFVAKAGFTSLYGGIKVEIPKGAGSLDTAHIIYDETAGFAATMKMFDHDPRATIEQRDSASTGRWTTRAPMLALRNPDPALTLPPETILQPMLLVRNTTSKSVKVKLDFHWRSASKDGRASLPEITFAPFESRKIDVGELQQKGSIPMDANWAEVSLSTNTLPDEVMAVAASFDSTLHYGAQTPFSDQLIAHLEGGQWLVDPTHTSLIAAGNGGNKPIKAALTIFYDQGRQKYQLEQTIAANDQWWVNFGELIRTQIADKNGNVLPMDLSSGAYQLQEISDPQQDLLFEGKVITDKTYGHATYGCMQCCGYGGPFGLVGNPTGVTMSGTSGVSSYATDQCIGTYVNVNPYFPTWTSSNTSILTASSYHVTGVAPGTATITANATRMPDGSGQDAKNGCPFRYVQTPGTGNVVNVSVNSANLWSNNISVTLSGPSTVTGALQVTLVGSSSSYTFQYGSTAVGSGTYSVAMNRPSIPADVYTSVKASWMLSSGPISGSFAVKWKVLGLIRHSQYNTPNEGMCVGATSNAWIIVLNGCLFTPIQLRSDFANQVYINGTGTSAAHGILKYTPGIKNNCTYPPGSNDSNTFLQVGSITGSCNTVLDTSSVATNPNPVTDITTYGCGDNLELITSSNTQQALKFPQDYCPACNSGFNSTNGHIDNYSSSQACSGHAVGDYGNYWTADTYASN